MSEEEKEAIEVLKKIKEKGYAALMIKYDKDRIATNTMLEMSIETILNLIQKQQEELAIKDKMIDSMSEFIKNKDIVGKFCEDKSDEFCQKHEECKNCIKEYFKNLI